VVVADDDERRDEGDEDDAGQQRHGEHGILQALIPRIGITKPSFGHLIFELCHFRPQLLDKFQSKNNRFTFIGV
jgi:hypothetical protein